MSLKMRNRIHKGVGPEMHGNQPKCSYELEIRLTKISVLGFLFLNSNENLHKSLQIITLK